MCITLNSGNVWSKLQFWPLFSNRKTQSIIKINQRRKTYNSAPLLLWFFYTTRKQRQVMRKVFSFNHWALGPPLLDVDPRYHKNKNLSITFQRLNCILQKLRLSVISSDNKSRHHFLNIHIIPYISFSTLLLLYL